MNDLRTIVIPTISDATKFEYLCRDLWNNEKNNEPVAFHGRPGQSQDGVDVYGRNNITNEWFGIQCKVRDESNKLTKKEIQDEIKLAKKFNPNLNSYYLCTTLRRDAKLQKIVREIIDDLKKENSFSFQVLFWDDIEEKLKDEFNLNVYYKYYEKFFVDNQTLGHAIGKLLNLELGIDKKLDTHYELLIGKITDIKDKDHTNVNYYRNTYYIVNFHENTMDVFKSPFFEIDIERVIKNRFDRFRITTWLNTIKNLDDFIYQDDYHIDFYISSDEYHNWLKEMKTADEDDT
jgi:hypothetical protein